VDKIASFLWRLNELRDFIDNVYLPDVLTVAEIYSDYFAIGKGCGNLLSYGGYELDSKEPDLTRFESSRNNVLSQNLCPRSGITSWVSLRRFHIQSLWNENDRLDQSY